jgi:non-homologous end joining protein Ku
VSCPVALYNAPTHARMVSFHLLNLETMNRIQMWPNDPDEFEDRYETALRQLINARAKGKTPAAPDALRDAKVAALKASLGRRRQAPAGGGTVVRLPGLNQSGR